MTADLRRSSFEPHLNETFRVRPSRQGGREVELLLVDVSGGVQGPMESFSLLFKGPFEGEFPHDTHALIHPVLGSREVFLGPVHTGKTDGIY